mmetsp:Transcript_13879/g.22327  ORF Transcript_13879/g.22327 Transcript_13879/m.22327 type:complete len:202 (-) Transcript_13879:1462-2067(-)
MSIGIAVLLEDASCLEERITSSLSVAKGFEHEPRVVEHFSKVCTKSRSSLLVDGEGFHKVVESTVVVLDFKFSYTKMIQGLSDERILRLPEFSSNRDFLLESLDRIAHVMVGFMDNGKLMHNLCDHLNVMHIFAFADINIQGLLHTFESLVLLAAFSKRHTQVKVGIGHSGMGLAECTFSAPKYTQICNRSFLELASSLVD